VTTTLYTGPWQDALVLPTMLTLLVNGVRATAEQPALAAAVSAEEASDADPAHAAV